MNCSTHKDEPAVAFCRTCGRALCSACRRSEGGTVYCAEHAQDPETAPGPGRGDPPYFSPATAPGHAHPRLAFLLGLIPGVGAIYNGQYAKGLIHALIFGLLISILDSHSAHGLEPLFGVLLGVFVLYMAFEAQHTARSRNSGQPVDEFSSLFQVRSRRSNTGAIALIVIGCAFLLNTLDVIELRQILRFWPLLLIGIGINMLHSRLADDRDSLRSNPGRTGEVNHER
ncbi:MAG TPA: DUF5668 domain-containing protein [Bryobacteraceae bacterium]|jgi:TM2 domain-containing membrane protein YozV|nr:DUF5668 domain-containing protein [Bryobacteraceae bacterium]